MNPPEVDAMIALFDAKQFDEALAKVDEFLAKNGKSPMAWRFKGECLSQLKRYPEAIPCFETASRSSGSAASGALVAMATAQWNAGLHDEAKATLESVLDAGPDKYDESTRERAMFLRSMMESQQIKPAT